MNNRTARLAPLRHCVTLYGLALGLFLPASMGIAGTAANSNRNGGNPDSVLGIPTPAPGVESYTNTPPPPAAAAPVQNYYGANPSGTYTNTDSAPGPASTEPDSAVTAPIEETTPPPTGAPTPVLNPNSAAASSGGPP